MAGLYPHLFYDVTACRSSYHIHVSNYKVGNLYQGDYIRGVVCIHDRIQGILGLLIEGPVAYDWPLSPFILRHHSKSLFVSQTCQYLTIR